jgi:flagellar hook-basal body complex protein FliE
MAVGPIDPAAISMIQPHAPYDGGTPVGPGSAPAGSGFGSLFVDALGRANAADNIAHDKAVELAAGRTDDIHGTMIEAQKANIELKLVGNVRNKVVDAFYELWRMSV